MKTLLLFLLLFTLSTQAQITVKQYGVQLPDVSLDSITDPHPGAIAFSDSTLYYYTGTHWQGLQPIRLGYGSWEGDPDQEDFTDVWGEPDYFFQFTFVNLHNGYRVFQGSYIPGAGYHFVKLKQ